MARRRENTEKDFAGRFLIVKKSAPQNPSRWTESREPLLLGGGLGLVDTRLQTLCPAMTATVQFLLAFDFFVSHER